MHFFCRGRKGREEKKTKVTKPETPPYTLWNAAFNSCFVKDAQKIPPGREGTENLKSGPET